MQIIIDVTEQQAESLSQLLKRLQWDHFRQCATNDTECEQIINAVDVLRREFAKAGYNPR